MAIAVRREQEVAVLEWTRRDVGKLSDAVRQELDGGAKRILLDLSKVDYLKGGGFETLTEVLSAADKAEAVIGMCNVDRGISILMEQLGLGPGFFPPDLGSFDDALARIQELEHQPLPAPEEEPTDTASESQAGLEIAFETADAETDTLDLSQQESAAVVESPAVSHDTPTDHERSVPDLPMDVDDEREVAADAADAATVQNDSESTEQADTSNSADLEDALGVDFKDGVFSYSSDEDSDDSLELDVGDLLPTSAGAPDGSAMRSLTNEVAGTVVMDLDDIVPMSPVASRSNVSSTPDSDVIDLGDDLFGDDTNVSSTSPTPPQGEKVTLGPLAYADQPVEDALGVDWEELSSATTQQAQPPDDVSTDDVGEDDYEATWSLDGMGEPATFPATPSSDVAETPASNAADAQVTTNQALEDSLGVNWTDLPGAAADLLGPHRVEEVQIPDELDVLDLGESAKDEPESLEALQETADTLISDDSTFDIDERAASATDLTTVSPAGQDPDTLAASDEASESTTDTQDDLLQTFHFLERYGFRKPSQINVLNYLVQLSQQVTAHTVRDVELGTGVGTGTVKATLDRFDRFGLLHRHRAKSMFQRDVYHFQPEGDVLKEAQIAVSRYRTASGQTRINAWLEEVSGIPG